MQSTASIGGESAISIHQAKSKELDKKIEDIICRSTQNSELSSLFNHPKLMANYYWKGDKILTK